MSRRNILIDIHDLGLDPKTRFSSTSASGRLKMTPSPEIVQDEKVNLDLAESKEVEEKETASDVLDTVTSEAVEAVETVEVVDEKKKKEKKEKKPKTEVSQ